MVYGEVGAWECLKWSNSVGLPGIEGQVLANGVGLDVDANIKTREFISVGICSTSCCASTLSHAFA